MDEQRRSFIITGITLIVVLSLIFGSIYFLVKAIKNRKSTNSKQTFPSVSVVPLRVEEPSPTPRSSAISVNSKTYQGQGFTIKYPKNWGLLTCRNSKNIEFDPNNSTNQLNVLCDVALKPVTVLVYSNNCSGGETVDLGGVSVTRIKTPTQTGVNYQQAVGYTYKWCTRLPNLEISHRVSSTGSRATSKQDLSKEIEQMIINSFGSSDTK